MYGDFYDVDQLQEQQQTIKTKPILFVFILILSIFAELNSVNAQAIEATPILKVEALPTGYNGSIVTTPNGELSYLPNQIPYITPTYNNGIYSFGKDLQVQLTFTDTQKNPLTTFQLDADKTIPVLEKKGNIHYGLNIENIATPIETAEFTILTPYKIEYDSFIEKETGFNISTYDIPALNLELQFDDLQKQNFTIKPNTNGVTVIDLSEKRNLLLDPIVYSAPTVTVTGFNSSVPCTFMDIVNADTAGGWGVYTADATGTQINCAGKIIIGDGANATVFSDTAKQVIFLDNIIPSSGSGQILISVAANSTLTLGTVVNASLKSSINGCAIIALEASNYYFYMIKAAATTSTVNLYSCTFSNVALGEVFIHATTIWNCLFIGNASELQCLYCSDAFNLTFTGANSYGLRTNPPAGATISNIFCLDTLRYLYFTTTGGTVTNLYGRKTGAANRFSIESVTTSDVYLINADVDSWLFSWSGASTKYVYRQYTIDLVVQDSTGTAIEDAVCILTDNASTEIFNESTDATGVIAQQTVTRGYYNQANGNTLQDSSPHTLTISKAGYQTYTQTFTLTEKTNWKITLLSTEQTSNDAILTALIVTLVCSLLAFSVLTKRRNR